MLHTADGEEDGEQGRRKGAGCGEDVNDLHLPIAAVKEPEDHGRCGKGEDGNDHQDDGKPGCEEAGTAECHHTEQDREGHQDVKEGA